MTTKMKSILIAIVAVLLTSCVSTSFYQVYQVAPSDKLVSNENSLIYEDENCKVSYNLWDEGGNIGFRFFNKTDENIFLNLEESFFMLNGIAYDYYKNRVFTNSTSSGATSSSTSTQSHSLTGINYLNLIQTNRTQAIGSAGLMASSGYSISYYEEKTICIPSKSSKIVTEYKINEYLYRDCDLFKYPITKKAKSKTFSKSDSPFVFSNRISYSIGNLENSRKFENEFYVDEITNYPENAIIDSKYEEFCGQQSVSIMKKYFKEVSPNKFYIKYGVDTWIH